MQNLVAYHALFSLKRYLHSANVFCSESEASATNVLVAKAKRQLQMF
ncbi:hypothetical protein [Lysinibacillus sp. TE18511]